MNYFHQSSERLNYRALTKNDITSWIEFFENNDRLRFLGTDESKSFEVLAEEWIDKQLKRYQEASLGMLAVELKDTGELIGMCGIIPRELNGKKEYEIGYSLKSSFWGKGYATEMAQTIKAFGVSHIETDRFISIIHIENTLSVNVAVKNGMKILFNTQFMGMEVNVYGINILS